MVIKELKEQLDCVINDQDTQDDLICRLREKVKNNQTQISNVYGLRDRSKERLNNNDSRNMLSF